MRALVTGCAGFIGSHLTETLLDAGHAVVGIDCFNDNYGREQKLTNLRHVREWTNFEFVPIDLSQGDLLSFVQSTDVIFHLAAEPGVRSSWGARYERYVRNNVLATQHVLEACRTAPDVRIVFASSSSVYGDMEAGGSSEDAPTRPISPYGQTKLSAEHLCNLYRRECDLDIVCLRYFTVFGPRQRPDMAFHKFLRAALSDTPIEIFGDGRQTRDFTYVADVVAATIAAGVTPELDERLLNIGGGSPTSLLRVLEIVEELVEKRVEVEYLERGEGEVRDTWAQTARARDALGFLPQTTLQRGLGAELDWLVALLEGRPERLAV